MGWHTFGAVEIHGAVDHRTAKADAYCFCLTSEVSSATLQGSEHRQAVIEIGNPEELLRLISVQTPRLQFKTPRLGAVKYAEYTAEGLATGAGHVDPLFMKRRNRPDGYSFEGEHEHRMIWTGGNTYIAGETGEMDPSPPLTWFFTRPTKQIARQLNRVA